MAENNISMQDRIIRMEENYFKFGIMKREEVGNLWKLQNQKARFCLEA